MLYPLRGDITEVLDSLGLLVGIGSVLGCIRLRRIGALGRIGVLDRCGIGGLDRVDIADRGDRVWAALAMISHVVLWLGRCGSDHLRRMVLRS